jgi:hypothetical protein
LQKNPSPNPSRCCHSDKLIPRKPRQVAFALFAFQRRDVGLVSRRHSAMIGPAVGAQLECPMQAVQGHPHAQRAGKYLLRHEVILLA